MRPHLEEVVDSMVEAVASPEGAEVSVAVPSEEAPSVAAVPRQDGNISRNNKIT